MARFVLVHPAWFGGWCWRKLCPLLRAAGHTVYTPTLTGLGERAHLATPQVDLSTHVDDVLNVMIFEDLDEVILVGSSSAGAVVTAVADRTPDLLSRVIYLDAFVPADGQSLVDLIPPERRPAMERLVAEEGDGWLLPRFAPPPWEQFLPAAWQVTDPADLRWAIERLRPTPFGHFTEPVRLSRGEAESPRRTYVRCRQWPNPSYDSYAAEARSSPAWDHYELATPHLPYLTHPHELGALLDAITG
jgi:pimeloyl-ACP methyl ester carboxylesterase